MDDEGRSGAGTVYAFGPFAFDPQHRTLRRDGAELRLTSRAHDVLHCLLAHHGQLASKRQLLTTVWPGIVVEESSLTQAIHELRTVLGEKPRDRRYILTVSGRGYQFVGDVRAVERCGIEQEASPQIDSETPAPVALPAAVVTAPARWRPLPLIGAASAVVVAWSLAASVVPMSSTRFSDESVATTLARVHAEEARYFLGRRGPGDVDRAMNAAQAAVAADPGYAAAWAGLASVHAIRASLQDNDPDIEHERMRGAAEQALRLDPREPQALVRLASYQFDRGQPGAARELMAKAAKIAPEDPLLLAVQAGIAAFNGRIDEAVRLEQRAVRRSPLNAVERGNLGHYLYASGHFAEAREQFQAVIDLTATQDGNPVAQGAAMGIARIDVAAGRPEDARRIVDDLPQGVEREYCLALIESAAGNRAAADAALARVQAQGSDDHAYLLAEVHAFRRDLDAAFHWLAVGDRALASRPDQREDRIWDVHYSPIFATAHHDPRWHQWVAANL